MLKRPMILGAALAALHCVPASAQAPKVDGLKPCYVSAGPLETQREPVSVRATNFTKLSTVDILVDETLQATAAVDFTGAVVGSVPAPFIASGQAPFTLRVAEKDNAMNTASQMSLVTAFSVSQTPKVSKTKQRVRFRGRGFVDSTYVYAHYLFRGIPRKTVQIAYPEGPCGTFDEKRRQFPFKRKPDRGTWTIQFDQVPNYDPRTKTKVTMNINVKRAPKQSRGR
jgi:hypothetical protein